MECANMIGKDFETLAQRVVYGILGSYPDFRPIASSEATEESQRQMHAFLRGVIHGIYEHPEALGIQTASDDCYEGWQVNNVRPELIKLMRKTSKPVIDFYAFLQAVGMHGAVEGTRLRLSCADVTARKAAASGAWVLWHRERGHEGVRAPFKRAVPGHLPGMEAAVSHQRTAGSAG
jgi:hypothetical protein